MQRLVVDSADWTLVERSYTKLNAHTARPITVLCVCVCEGSFAGNGVRLGSPQLPLVTLPPVVHFTLLRKGGGQTPQGERETYLGPLAGGHRGQPRGGDEAVPRDHEQREGVDVRNEAVR